MKIPVLPDNELERLRTLQTLNILDSKPEDRFDTITRLTQHLFNIPVAVISLVDENRQWFKSCMGLDAQETPRDISFCGHAILKPDILIVEDTHQDERFSDNPLVIGEPFIRFYAGKPLAAPNGDRIGTLCVIDDKPRKFSEEDQTLLTDCAVLVEREIKILYEAAKDSITDAYNYLGFLTISQYELLRCARDKSPASLIYFDVAQTENQALLEFTVHLKAALQSRDVFGRVDNKEFVLLLPDTDRQQAEAILEKINQELEGNPDKPSLLSDFSFSHSIECFNPSFEDSIEQRIKDRSPQ
jgi:GGDEF domain-containing protein